MTRFVNSLLLKGMKVDNRGNDRNTALFISAQLGHTDTAKLLLDRGAKLSAKNLYLNWEPLHCAANSGHVQMVKLLLENWADHTVADLRGKTVLHLAALRGHDAVIELLLDSGSNIGALDHGKNTALHIASAYSQ